MASALPQFCFFCDGNGDGDVEATVKCCDRLLCEIHWSKHSSKQGPHQPIDVRRRELTTRCLRAPPGNRFFPYADVFTCRREEYLRKAFDELSHALRFLIGGTLELALTSPALRYKRMFFSVDYWYKKENKLKFYVRTAEARQAVQSIIQAARDARGEEPRVEYCKSFFDMPESSDYNALLRHLLTAHRKYCLCNEDKSILQFLIGLRCSLVHRSLGTVGCADVKLCLERFFADVEYLLFSSGLAMAAAKIRPDYLQAFQAHRKQVCAMKIALPTFELMSSSPSEEVGPQLARLQADEDVAALFLPRFHLPSTAAIGDSDSKEDESKEKKNADDASVENQDGEFLVVESQYKLKIPKRLTNIPLVRWDVKPAASPPVIQSVFVVGDAMSVAHVDILSRAFDALGVVFHDALLGPWTRSTVPQRRALYGTLKPIVQQEHEVIHKTEAKLNHRTTLVKLGETLDFGSPDAPPIYDPFVLLHLLHEKGVAIFPNLKLQQAEADALAQLMQCRDAISHQHYSRNPTEIKIQGVQAALQAMVFLIEQVSKADLISRKDYLNSEAIECIRFLKTLVVVSLNYSQFRTLQFRFTLDREEAETRVGRILSYFAANPNVAAEHRKVLQCLFTRCRALASPSVAPAASALTRAKSSGLAIEQLANPFELLCCADDEELFPDDDTPVVSVVENVLDDGDDDSDWQPALAEPEF